MNLCEGGRNLRMTKVSFAELHAQNPLTMCSANFCMQLKRFQKAAVENFLFKKLAFAAL